MSMNEILQSAYELPLEQRKELTNILNKSIEDPNLQIDPYFYERKKELNQLLKDVDSGKEPMYDFNESMDELIQELKS